jgi:hypothetical protein
MANKTRKVFKRAAPGEIRQLYSVLSIPEVAAGWHKHPKTVKLAIDTGRLVARQAGQMWLILEASVIRLWGEALEREEHSF